MEKVGYREVGQYIAEKNNKRIAGKIYLPTLIAENMELQIGFSLGLS